MRKLTFAILLTMLIITAAGCPADGPRSAKTASEFLKSWVLEDYEGMYDLLDARSRERYDLDYLVSLYTGIAQKVRLYKLDASLEENLSSNRDSAEYYFSIRMHTHTVGEVPVRNTITLNREKSTGKWLIAWDPSLIFPELTGERRVEVKRHLPRRGSIYDRHGNALAEYRLFKEVGVVHGRYGEMETLIEKLKPLLHLTSSELEKKLTQSWIRDGLYVPIAILSPANVELIDELLKIQGVMINNVKERYYPGGESTGHPLGYLGEISREELAERKEEGFFAGDFIGKTGIEGALDDILAGFSGFSLQIVEKDGSLAALVARKEGEDGSDVYLTIDRDLQQAAWEALSDNIGALVALEPSTGDLLAMVSKPGFDPNCFIGGIHAAAWQELVEDPALPLLNRALTGLYPPGSAFKVYTAAAAVQEGVIDPEKSITIEGDRWQYSSSWGGYRVRRVRDDIEELDLKEGMKYSDNIYFAQAGLALGNSLFESYGERFGFDKKIPFPLPVAVSRLCREELASDILLADSSFGQGEILMTPLHMALLYSAFPAGGKIPLPRLIYEEDSAGSVWKETVETTTAALIHDALVYTINSSEAPAGAGAINQYEIAGKTGTAQVDNIEGNICWYVTYSMVPPPGILVAVMIEGGTWAGDEALPLGRAVLETYLIHNDLIQARM